MSNSVDIFLQRVKTKLQGMTPEEVLALHEEAQATMADPIYVETDKVAMTATEIMLRRRNALREFSLCENELREEIEWCVQNGDEVNALQLCKRLEDYINDSL